MFSKKRINCISILIALFSIFVSCIYCTGSEEREYIPTGISKNEQPDDTIEYKFTSRASQNAVKKNNRAMMRSTSREGARLLMENEFRNRGLDRSKFKKTDFEFLRKGEYCRITGVYYPEGIPVKKEPDKKEPSKKEPDKKTPGKKD